MKFTKRTLAIGFAAYIHNQGPWHCIRWKTHGVNAVAGASANTSVWSVAQQVECARGVLPMHAPRASVMKILGWTACSRFMCLCASIKMKTCCSGGSASQEWPMKDFMLPKWTDAWSKQVNVFNMQHRKPPGVTHPITTTCSLCGKIFSCKLKRCIHVCDGTFKTLPKWLLCSSAHAHLHLPVRLDWWKTE